MIFEHQGCFYIVDWKSNRLGHHQEAYAPSELHRVMETENYFLQSRFYTMALDRYLNQRLADYSYERHFGGIFYLFVRGMSPDTGKACGVFFDKPALDHLVKLREEWMP